MSVAKLSSISKLIDVSPNTAIEALNNKLTQNRLKTCSEDLNEYIRNLNFCIENIRNDNTEDAKKIVAIMQEESKEIIKNMEKILKLKDLFF